MEKKIQNLRKRKTRQEREEILRNRMGLHFLNSKELLFLNKIFKLLDKDNSNTLSKEEFIKALNSYGCSFEEGKIFSLFNETDKNGTKTIDFDEFIDNISSEIKLSEETLRKIFEIFAGDNGEFITFDELKRINKINNLYTDEELKELIDGTDNTHNGKVNFEDFYNIIMTKV